MNKQTVQTTVREVGILTACDIVIAGGGTAGVAAAVSAARLGMNVVIIEKNNAFGGLWTNGLVLRLYGTHAYRDGSLVNYMGGIGAELVQMLMSMPGAVRTFGENCFEPTPDPEAAIYCMDQLCTVSGVTPLFNTMITDVVVCDNQIQAVICQSNQGVFAVQAKAFIDCTGDCNLAYLAGDQFRLCTAYQIGLNHILAGIKDVDDAHLREVYGHPGVMENNDTLWINMTGSKCDFTDVQAMSRLEISHRDKMWAQLKQLRELCGSNAPYITHTATQMGTRVTRVLLAQDYMEYDRAVSGAEVSRPIGVSGWANYDGEFKRKMPGYQIPYEITVSARYQNLWTAGRSVCADDRIMNNLRLVPNCLITGQGAGVAAALAVKNHVANGAVSAEELSAALTKQDCILML